MKTLYFDCFAGIAGDMAVAALLDLGVHESIVADGLDKLGLDGYRLNLRRVSKNGVDAQRFDVLLDEPAHGHHHHEHHHEHRSMKDIRALIGGSSLPEKVKRTALDIFAKIAVAEGKVHGRPPDEVHFHEVGAVDSIVDIVSFALCLHTLSPDRVVCSPIREGHGFVRCQHGLIPVPAPATLELLKDCGAVLHPADTEGEMVTPTGAGILAAVASRFGEPLPAGTVVGTGYGAGAKDFPHPNVLRAVLVETDPRADADGETVLELCCNLDDCTGEELGYVTELLFKQGALDVCHTPIFMKKNRPATMLTVLAPPRLEDALCGLILRHTSTLGVRVTRTRRVTLERSFVTVSTPYGPVRVKRAQIDGLQKLAPEYESVREAAQTHGVTLREVSQAALTAYEGGLFRNDGR